MVILSLAVCAHHATGETLTWGGGTAGGNTNMATAGNWLENTAPSETSDLVISTRNGTAVIPTLHFGDDYTIRSLSVDNSAGRFGDNGLRIGPATSSSSTTQRTVTFGTAGITMLSATNDAALTLWRFTTSASMTFNLGYTGVSSIHVDDTSSILIGTASITGTGGINKTGAGTLTLGSTNTFTGGLTISEGTVSVGSTLHLGSSTAADAVVIDGGTLLFTHSSAITNTATRGFQVGSSTGTIEVANGAATVRFAGSNTVGNVTGETGILRKTGAGTLSIENGLNTTHTGGTLLNEGRLVLALDSTLGGTGGIGITALGGTTLQGSGIINGDSSFADGATIDIATMSNHNTVSNAIGTLFFDGNLTVGAAMLLFDLGLTASSDLVTLAAGMVLDIGNGTFDLSNFTFTALAGFDAGTYTLISTDQSIVGSFGSQLTGTVDGRDVTLALAESGNSIELVVASAIPEPSVYAALAGAAGLFCTFLRRRKG